MGRILMTFSPDSGRLTNETKYFKKILFYVKDKTL